jgi:hypothetical protein
MTEAQAIELIFERFVDPSIGWPAVSQAAVGVSLPFALENEGILEVDSFAQLTVRHSVSQPITMGPIGGRRFERRGTIYVKLWGASNAGRAGLSALADAVRSIFEGQQLGSGEPITIDGGLTREIGVDGRYFMAVVQFPMRYYATL